MVSSGTINAAEHSGETHYLIEKAKKEALERQKTNQWIYNHRKSITEFLLIFGLTAGMGIVYLTTPFSQFFLSIGNMFSLLISLSVMFIIISALVEIVNLSKLFKENVKYHPPIYGIIALVFNVFGLIIMTMFNSGNLFSTFGTTEGLEILLFAGLVYLLYLFYLHHIPLLTYQIKLVFY